MQTFEVNVLTFNDSSGAYDGDVKEIMTEAIESQPDDASYEEIMRALAFARLVRCRLADARAGRVLSNEEMEHRIGAMYNNSLRANSIPIAETYTAPIPERALYPCVPRFPSCALHRRRRLRP